MTNLNYLHLYYFWTVANERGFSKASKQLDISQSAISLQIQTLEKNIGKKLIIRSPKKFELTNDGSLVKSHCDEIFSSGERLELILRGKVSTTTHTVSLGMTWDFPISIFQKISSTRRRAGDDSIKVESGSFDELIPQLFERKLDVVYSNTRPSQNTDRRLMVRKLQGSNFAVVGRFKKQRSKKGGSGDLERAPFFVQSASLLKQNHLRDWLDKKKLTPLPQEISSFRNMAAYLESEPQALAYLPVCYVEKLKQNVEIKVLHEFRQNEHPCFAIYRNGSEKSKNLKDWILG